MLNVVTIMGRICADPELRFTANQKPVANFTVAIERDRDREEADFIDVVAWNGTAEFVSKYFKKGSMIVVNGRLQMRKYEAKDGAKRTTYEIVSNNVYFGEAKRDGA